MAGKTQALSKGKTAVKAKAKVKTKTKAGAASAVAAPEPAGSVDILEQAEQITMADAPADLEQTAAKDTPTGPEEVVNADLTNEPEQTATDAIPPVRPEWVGRVCCGLAVRAYAQNLTKAPIGMSCEVHGPRYYVTADNVPFP